MTSLLQMICPNNEKPVLIQYLLTCLPTHNWNDDWFNVVPSLFAWSFTFFYVINVGGGYSWRVNFPWIYEWNYKYLRIYLPSSVAEVVSLEGNDLVKIYLSDSGFLNQIEYLDWGGTSWPDEITLSPFDSSKSELWDTICFETFTSCNFVTSALNPGSTVRDSENTKLPQYLYLSGSLSVYTPFLYCSKWVEMFLMNKPREVVRLVGNSYWK